MSDANMLTEFFIKLGWNVDGAGTDHVAKILRATTVQAQLAADAIEKIVGKLKDFSEGIATAYEDLYYASQRNRASVENIKAFGYAAANMGSSVGAARDSIENFGKSLRSNSGFYGVITSMGVRVKNANGTFRDSVDILTDLGKVIAKKPEQQRIQYAELFGLDEQTMRAIISPDFARNMQEYKNIIEAGHFDPQGAAESWKDFNNTFRNFMTTLDLLVEKVQTRLIKEFNPAFQAFVDYLIHNSDQITTTIMGVIDRIIDLAKAGIKWLGEQGDFNKIWGKTRAEIASVGDVIATVVGWVEKLVGFLRQMNQYANDAAHALNWLTGQKDPADVTAGRSGADGVDAPTGSAPAGVGGGVAASGGTAAPPSVAAPAAPSGSTPPAPASTPPTAAAPPPDNSLAITPPAGNTTPPIAPAPGDPMPTLPRPAAPPLAAPLGDDPTPVGPQSTTPNPLAGLIDFTKSAKTPPPAAPSTPPGASAVPDTPVLSEVDAARQYLRDTAQGNAAARQRDIADLHPDFVVKMAAAIKEARAEGLPVSIFSGARAPDATHGRGSSGLFDMAGYSLHPVGMASDMAGIGAPGSPTAQRWYDIATKHGIFNPYGVDNPREWNHFQAIPQRNLDRAGPVEPFYRDNDRDDARRLAMWRAEGLDMHGVGETPAPAPEAVAKKPATLAGALTAAKEFAGFANGAIRPDLGNPATLKSAPLTSLPAASTTNTQINQRTSISVDGQYDAHELQKATALSQLRTNGDLLRTMQGAAQ